jgi:alkyl hydroperoxide reductase subunit AhpC
MIELGELEGHHEEFAKRHTQVVAVSLECQDEAQQTKQDFPHLVVAADTERKLISAAGALHPGAGPGGADAAAPTTFLIDKKGVVRGLFRPDLVISRLSANEVLARVDAKLVHPR